MNSLLPILLNLTQNISLFVMFVLGYAVVRRRVAARGEDQLHACDHDPIA